MMKSIEHGAVKLCVGLLIVSFALGALKSIGHHTPPTEVATTAGRDGAAATAVARPRAASTTASARPAPASVDTIAPSALVVLWPALTPPAELVSGRVAYSLSAAPWIDYGQWGREVELGAATIDASASSFASLPVAALAADVPTNGRAREMWTWWVRVPDGGGQTLVVKLGAIAGNTASVALSVDTATTPAVAVTCCAPAIAGGEPQQVGVGTIDLAAGWHKLTLVAVHVPAAGPVNADVFVRGPSGPAPTTVTPFAPASTAPTSQSPSASTTSAPHAIPIAGEGHPAASTTEKKP